MLIIVFLNIKINQILTYIIQNLIIVFIIFEESIKIINMFILKLLLFPIF